jgi:hypothetical protein
LAAKHPQLNRFIQIGQYAHAELKKLGFAYVSAAASIHATRDAICCISHGDMEGLSNSPRQTPRELDFERSKPQSRTKGTPWEVSQIITVAEQVVTRTMSPFTI